VNESESERLRELSNERRGKSERLFGF